MVPTLLVLLLCALQTWTAQAMRADYLAQLRHDTVDMFYHGFSNYMQHAFPEDELRPLTCAPLTRDKDNVGDIGVNDVLGNYSLTLLDSLSTLAILAGGPEDGTYTGAHALHDFQDGITQFVEYYGDGRPGPSGSGIRAKGFDLDSKVQVFETVIRGVGGLLSAHLFASGELPITGYDPPNQRASNGDDPLELSPISWPNGFEYNGQLLRLALDLGQRLLPAFFTDTGIPYPRVNLRHGIPFYINSPLHRDIGDIVHPDGRREITETCSAGAGSLTLEFTVLSRLTGDPRFEHAAKRAFWEVWERRSEIGLIGNGIDAERGMWIGPHSGIGAGMDSFFEYALKSHILLSGHDMPNASTSQRQSRTDWLDPNSIHPPLPPAMHSSDAFLETWHQAHAAVKRHIHTDRNHYPYYSNIHRATGQPYTMWIDSLGAFYPGLLALAGEVEEAIEANLVYTALWTRYSALPERWSIRENNVESGIGWWPGRPEFIESTYHIYRATKDPWYLHVGEMVLRDIGRRCYAQCGWAGLQDVRTGEQQNRMESFFLGETTKYMYLLFDPDHPLNKLDAAYVFTTEGHPLLIPKHGVSKRQNPTPRKAQPGNQMARYSYCDEGFTNSCPASPNRPFGGSVTAARPDLFSVARFTDLHNTPNFHGPVEAVEVEEEGKGRITKYKAQSNHTIFPWTLPVSLLPENGSCQAPPERTVAWIEFPAADQAKSILSRFTGSSLTWHDHTGPTVKSLDGLKLQLEREASADSGEFEWRITQVGNTMLGRDESVYFYAEHVRPFRDDVFKVIRRSDVLDLQLIADVTSNDNLDNLDDLVIADNTGEAPLPHESDKPLEAPHSLLHSILRAVSSVFDPANTDTPFPSDSADPHIITWDALAAVGPGAFPMPAISETPVQGGPGFDDADPASKFPWKTVFLAGHACDGRLPNASSRQHQVIVMRRGGCSFSKKLENVPSFSPSRTALQLVIVIDEVGGPIEDTESARPLLQTEQLTPKGMKRLHGIPLVLLTGEPGDYDLFEEAAAVGMRRKYVVHSQGLPVGNAVVL